MFAHLYIFVLGFVLADIYAIVRFVLTGDLLYAMAVVILSMAIVEGVRYIQWRR